MHSWTSPHRGPAPLGQGGRAPDVQVCLDIFQKSACIISSKFCKKNFALKCIPGLALVGVLPLGQGGRPPDVQVGQEILQIATYIISIKFCICGPILSHNVTPMGL